LKHAGSTYMAMICNPNLTLIHTLTATMPTLTLIFTQPANCALTT